ncbi:MAG TPA: type II secretion system F family protein [Pirellulaceae bacterium]|nr:type II secretion system F family protein [Pirellulaceae bacterium]
MSPLIIIAIVFVAVFALIAAVGAMLVSHSATQAEDRLDLLTGASGWTNQKGKEGTSLLSTTADDSKTIAVEFLNRFGDIHRFLSQANVSITPHQFLIATIGLAVAGVSIIFSAGLPYFFAPPAAAALGALPFGFVFIARKRRIGAFARQLPDALELVSRALRAGHSLAAGINLVGSEMSQPIAGEFARCYEEQNLGIPLEETLEGMTERVPNLDLRFFATAVILQRQTGGDLAEILDKIGHLVRERFQIYGQIQALTGEGRLSGIVLLALPPVLFVVMYRLNPDYVMVLFTDEIGKLLLTGAVFMQVAGAFVIKKIINIKV